MCSHHKSKALHIGTSSTPVHPARSTQVSVCVCEFVCEVKPTQGARTPVPDVQLALEADAGAGGCQWLGGTVWPWVDVRCIEPRVPDEWCVIRPTHTFTQAIAGRLGAERRVCVLGSWWSALYTDIERNRCLCAIDWCSIKIWWLGCKSIGRFVIWPRPYCLVWACRTQNMPAHPLPPDLRKNQWVYSTGALCRFHTSFGNEHMARTWLLFINQAEMIELLSSQFQRNWVQSARPCKRTCAPLKWVSHVQISERPICKMKWSYRMRISKPFIRQIAIFNLVRSRSSQLNE